jgi:hypothetical protein
VEKTNSRARCVLAGLACAAIVFVWQWLTVRANYQGQWNALFCTGAQLRQPPELAAENIHLFPGSQGYDGQMYHYIAHDPFFSRGFSAYLDASRMRYRRILVPLAAHALALGRDEWVDRAYFGIILLAVFCGGYWLSAFATTLGYKAVWGLAFLLLPATLISMDRLTVDVALAALCVAFALYVGRNSMPALYAVLAAAALTRETGLLLVAAYVIWLLWNRDSIRAAVFATSAFPALLWYSFVAFNTEPDPFPILSRFPFQGIFERLLAPYHYAFAGSINAASTLLDYAALAGIVIAVALAVRMAWRRERGPIEIGVYLFAFLAMFLISPGAWTEVYAFGRTLSPLLLLLGLVGITKRNWIYALPLLLVIPRTAIQFAPQVAGVLRAI